MPIYEYRCTNGHTFEAFQSMSDDSLDACEVCDAAAQRVLSAPAVHFKGSGFYTTDYARKGAKSGSGSESDSGSSSDGDSKSSSDSGSDSKSSSDSKSDKKPATSGSSSSSGSSGSSSSGSSGGSSSSSD